MESGGLDGEVQSNTMFMERFLDWTGVLIEPNPVSYEKLREKHRKVWSVHACLSPQPYPQTVYTFYL